MDSQCANPLVATVSVKYVHCGCCVSKFIVYMYLKVASKLGPLSIVFLMMHSSLRYIVQTGPMPTHPETN